MNIDRWQSRSLGLVPVDDKQVIEQAAREIGFRVWTEPTKNSSLVEVFTGEPEGRDYGAFWDKCKELQGAD
jgi:hypothetical protein